MEWPVLFLPYSYPVFPPFVLGGSAFTQIYRTLAGEEPFHFTLLDDVNTN